MNISLRNKVETYPDISSMSHGCFRWLNVLSCDIKEHTSSADHHYTLDDTNILVKEDKWFLRKFWEALHIHKRSPALKRDRSYETPPPYPTPIPVTWPSDHVISQSTIEQVHVTWMKHLGMFQSCFWETYSSLQLQSNIFFCWLFLSEKNEHTIIAMYAHGKIWLQYGKIDSRTMKMDKLLDSVLHEGACSFWNNYYKIRSSHM